MTPNATTIARKAALPLLLLLAAPIAAQPDAGVQADAGARPERTFELALAVEDPVVDGPLDPGEARRVAQEHLADARRCLNARRVWTQEDLTHRSARVLVRLRVAPDGGVTASDVVESTTKAAELTACLATAARGWRFSLPRDGGGATVQYPFVLRFVEVTGTPSPGSLDKELIRQVVRRNSPSISACYEKVLQRHPKLAGKVTIRWLITADGTVATSSVAASTLGNAEVETCLVELVRTWRFPKPKGGGVVNVSYPFVFKKKGEPADAGAPAPAK